MYSVKEFLNEGVVGHSSNKPKFVSGPVKEEVNVEELIKELQGNFAGSNEDQMKSVQILKGLATSDDAKANEFMKALDKATTDISKEVLDDKSK